MGVYCGRFNDLIGCGGDTKPIKCHNNDVIVVMGSINQSKSFTTGVYRGRSPRSLPWEFTTGVYRRSVPREFTVGGYCGGSMIWLAVVGTLNQSNAITMMSLLWWGALTNQNHSPWEFTTGGHRRSLPREVTMGVYRGRLNDLIGCGGDT